MSLLSLLTYLKDYRQYLPIVLAIIGFFTGNIGLENLNTIKNAESPPGLSAYGNVAGHGLVSLALFGGALAIARRKTDPVPPIMARNEIVAGANSISDVEFCEIQRKLFDAFADDPQARAACLNLWQRFYAMNFLTPTPKPEQKPEEPPVSSPVSSHLQAILSEFQRLAQPSKDDAHDLSRPSPAPTLPGAAA